MVRMRAVVQRVSAAEVLVAGEQVGAIDTGLLVYLAAAREDTDADIRWTANKLASLRVFPDARGRMSCSVEQVHGALLVVSQFTLFGDVQKGHRPSFSRAASPEQAEGHYKALCNALRSRGLRVETGRFRAAMQVRSEGDGPVTILVDSRRAL